MPASQALPKIMAVASNAPAICSAPSPAPGERNLLFAYCGGIYIAGTRLDRLQLAIATSAFVVAAELQALGMYSWILGAETLISRIQEINPLFEAQTKLTFRRLAGIPLWQAGIIASLLFAWRVRRFSVKQLS